MKITKQSILLTVLVIGFSFQLFLPVESSLLVHKVQAADLVGTEWYTADNQFVLLFKKDDTVHLFIDWSNEVFVTGKYTESGNSIDMKFPQNFKISGKISGKTMKVKFHFNGKTEDY